LWTETIDEHRRVVRDAAIDATAALIAEHGLAGVSMSRIADQAGIGRATLYKYFPDVDAILLAWHQRQVADHLQQLTATREHASSRPRATPRTVVHAVLEAYALIQHRHHGGGAGAELEALVHRGEHVAHARRQLRDLLLAPLLAGVDAGEVRADLPADELAGYCLHALNAAADLPSKAAVRRLVALILDSLRPLP
jgi:AcrR family transcriptional regulator